MDKIIDPSIAAKAYANTVKTKDSGGDDGVSFSDFLKGKAAESIDSIRQSEQLSAKAVTGEAEITDVVAAVTSAEMTLQTIISIRDRIIAAYQDIMRTGI